MDPELQTVLFQMPGWLDAPDLIIEPWGGLTNQNYRVTVNGERFIVRISGNNTALLGIDRQAELAALQIAESTGIGPEVVRFFLPAGHLVTRYIEGRHWTYAEYCTPANLGRIVERVKQVHAFPPVKAEFSAFRRIESQIRTVQRMGAPFPKDFQAFIDKMHAIEACQEADPDPWRKFCHNDLFSVNYLDDGKEIRIIDWEFAGMGDIYFDLTALVNSYDDIGPIPPDLETFLLECYFGEVTTHHRQRLEGMKYILLFFSAMWGLLQHAMLQSGKIPAVEGFDYLDFSEDCFRQMRKWDQNQA